VGWKTSYMDMYDGNQNSYYLGGVDDVLTTVVKALEENPERTFTYAELTYFKIWFYKQIPQKRESVKKLIESGQLGIPNGGMSAPDETIIGYDQFLDNFMAGHRFLTEEVGVDPSKLTKTTW